MACEKNNSFTQLLGAALVIGLSILGSVLLIKDNLTDKSRFEFKQEGPVFIRFNKQEGEMCYTGLAPNGKFATETWLCMAGDKTKEAKSIDFSAQNKDNSQTKKKAKK